MGFDMAAQNIKDNNAKLILLAADISPKSAKEIIRLTDRHEIDVINIPAAMDEVMGVTGKRAGILAITDKGLSESLRKSLDVCHIEGR